MSSETVTQLTTAFSPDKFMATFLTMAPFIMTVVGLVVGVGIVKWGVRRSSRKLTGGM